MDAHETIALLGERIKDFPELAPVLECKMCAILGRSVKMAPYQSYRLNSVGPAQIASTIPAVRLMGLEYECPVCKYGETAWLA